MEDLPRRSWPFRCGVAVLAVGVATVVQFALNSLLGSFDRPFIMFFFAVVFTAWYARLGAAVVAIVLGSLVANYFFLHPTLAIQAESLRLWTFVIIFGLGSFAISLMIERMHQATGRAVHEAEQRRRSETALRNSDHLLRTARDDALAANAAKDRFLAVLSHELRTPLSPILLLASEHATDASLPDEIREAFSMISKNASMEAHLIDDLLDISRIIHGKLVLHQAAVEIHAILEDSVNAVATEVASKNITLKRDWEAARSNASADALRLKQVFSNLLRNAIKFTAPGGSITLRTALSFDNRGLIVTLADTGLGMNEEELRRAFKPFAQGDHAATGAPGTFGGLGLGLAIAKQLVESHGGTIVAESAGRGCGTRITLQLPLEPVLVSPSLAGENSLHPAKEPGEVLPAQALFGSTRL